VCRDIDKSYRVKGFSRIYIPQSECVPQLTPFCVLAVLGRIHGRFPESDNWAFRLATTDGGDWFDQATLRSHWLSRHTCRVFRSLHDDAPLRCKALCRSSSAYHGDIYRTRGTLRRQNPLIDDTPQFLGFTHVSPTKFFPPLVGLVLIYDTTSPMDT